MADELDRIFAADEECRSRLAFAQNQIERQLEEAARERERAIAEQQRAVAEALERELAAVRAEGDARIAVRGAALDDYLRRLDERGEECFEAAAQMYARIVRGEAEGGER
ncbi:MAG TPA: hypothetical protein VF980_16230 [Thermoanaerobaculia bacterium]